MNRIKLSDRLSYAMNGDVTKGAARGIVANGRLGWVGEIVLMRPPNFMRFTQLLLN